MSWLLIYWISNETKNVHAWENYELRVESGTFGVRLEGLPSAVRQDDNQTLRKTSKQEKYVR